MRHIIVPAPAGLQVWEWTPDHSEPRGPFPVLALACQLSADPTGLNSEDENHTAYLVPIPGNFAPMWLDPEKDGLFFSVDEISEARERHERIMTKIEAAARTGDLQAVRSAAPSSHMLGEVRMSGGQRYVPVTLRGPVFVYHVALGADGAK
jgi:hypothetical protein